MPGFATPHAVTAARGPCCSVGSMEGPDKEEEGGPSWEEQRLQERTARDFELRRADVLQSPDDIPPVRGSNLHGNGGCELYGRRRTCHLYAWVQRL